MDLRVKDPPAQLPWIFVRGSPRKPTLGTRNSQDQTSEKASGLGADANSKFPTFQRWLPRKPQGEGTGQVASDMPLTGVGGSNFWWPKHSERRVKNNKKMQRFSIELDVPAAIVSPGLDLAQNTWTNLILEIDESQVLNESLKQGKILNERFMDDMEFSDKVIQRMLEAKTRTVEIQDNHPRPTLGAVYLVKSYARGKTSSGKNLGIKFGGRMSFSEAVTKDYGSFREDPTIVVRFLHDLLNVP